MDLFSDFDTLLKLYSEKLSNKEVEATLRDDLLSKLDRFPGVYIIRYGKETIYIGSSGKVNGNLNSGKSSVKNRLTSSYTPYTIRNDTFKYSPYGRIDGTNRPEGYNHEIALKNLMFSVFDLTQKNDQVIAPSALEHVLIQSYINQYKKLPIANQKI